MGFSWIFQKEGYPQKTCFFSWKILLTKMDDEGPILGGFSIYKPMVKAIPSAAIQVLQWRGPGAL